MKLILNLIIKVLAVWITIALLPGVHVNSWETIVAVAIAFALINITIKPLIKLVTFPVTLFTLGLFSLIINAILVMLVSFIIKGFVVDNFLWAIAFGIVMSIINPILQRIFKH